MIIETYLDASRLSPGQALVVIDENGKRWDALEALNSNDMSASGSGSSSSGRSDNNNKIRTRSTEIILERWKVELRCIPSLLKTGTGDAGSGAETTGSGGPGEKGRASEGGSGASSVEYEIEDFGPILPTIYKRSIVFFRSLFVTTNVLPAYRFSRQATTKNVHPALKVCCRVLTGADAEARINARGFDNLRQPLVYDGAREPVTDYMFGDLEVPIGRFSASVTYRNDCSFRVDDSESLLSSRFMGIDENYFRPSIPHTTQNPDNAYLASQRHVQQQQGGGQQHRRQSSATEAPVGSLPSHHRHARNIAEPSYRPQPQQTYGSLSTFHGPDALATSPISALKAVRPLGSDTSSPTDSIQPSSSMEQRPQIDPPNSLPIAAGRHAGMSPSSTPIAARPPTLRNLDGLSRRPSVSFQPFKAGSLSSSPRVHDDMPIPSSPLSGSRPTSGLSALAQARNRNSLTAGMAASLRGAPMPSTSAGSAVMGAATMDPGPSSSPRLGGGGGGSRYSSSFTHRRARSSFGGTSRNEDDQGSSGKQSLASSMAQPGSGLLAEVGGVASSGSFQTDDDNISEFLKTLESKKTLQSFEVSSKRGDSARRTVAQLSRFQMMRDSNAALTDSMNASTSPSLSQQQLPPRSIGSSSRQLPAASQPPANTSASFSPSSHSPIKSPHTPHTPHTPAVPSRLSENAVIDYQGSAHGSRAVVEDDEADDKRTRGTTAIDIPLSPRPLQPGGGGRRSSSAVQKTRAHRDDDSADLAAFGTTQRSLSAGADDREPPSPGALFRLEAPETSSGVASAGGSAATGAGVGAGAGAVGTSPGHALGTPGGLKAAAAGILRPSSGGALPRSTGLGDDDDKMATARVGSLPPNALAATSAALRATANMSATMSANMSASATQRRRYTGRQQSVASPLSPQQPTASETVGRGSTVGSDGRPTPPQTSRGSFSGSFLGRYSGSGRGGSGAGSLTGGGPGASGDDDDLLFALSEIGRAPSRRSIDEARGGSHNWRQQ